MGKSKSRNGIVKGEVLLPLLFDSNFFTFNTRIRQMHGMRAVDELNEDQVREMAFDLESAYNSLHAFLSSKK